MAIGAEYSLIPYDPVRPHALAGRPAATVGRGQPERFRERSQDARPAAKASPPGLLTYSARRTLEPQRIAATGMMVDIFV